MEDQSLPQKGKFRIVAFIGPIGVGKTTVADRWRALNPRYATVNFADGLRKVVELVYGIPFSDQKMEHVKKQSFECLNGNTLRFALQHLGTEGFRTVSPYTWTDYFHRVTNGLRSTGKYDGVVVEDVRFLNEFQSLVAMGDFDNIDVCFVPVFNSRITAEWKLNAALEARPLNRFKLHLLKVFPGLARWGLTAYRMHESERQMIQIFLALDQMPPSRIFDFDNSEFDATGELLATKTRHLYEQICAPNLELVAA